MFLLIRILMAALFLSAGFFIIWKRKWNKTMAVAGLLVIGIGFMTLSTLFPFENYFHSFSTAEDAFHYRYRGEILEKLEGNESTFILYRTERANRDDVAFAAFPKANNAWQLGWQFTKTIPVSGMDCLYYHSGNKASG